MFDCTTVKRTLSHLLVYSLVLEVVRSVPPVEPLLLAGLGEVLVVLLDVELDAPLLFLWGEEGEAQKCYRSQSQHDSISKKRRQLLFAAALSLSLSTCKNFYRSQVTGDDRAKRIRELLLLTKDRPHFLHTFLHQFSLVLLLLILHSNTSVQAYILQYYSNNKK